jgi:hypothetical protein
MNSVRMFNLLDLPQEIILHIRKSLYHIALTSSGRCLTGTLIVMNRSVISGSARPRNTL